MNNTISNGKEPIISNTSTGTNEYRYSEFLLINLLINKLIVNNTSNRFVTSVYINREIWREFKEICDDLNIKVCDALEKILLFFIENVKKGLKKYTRNSTKNLTKSFTRNSSNFSIKLVSKETIKESSRMLYIRISKSEHKVTCPKCGYSWIFINPDFDIRDILQCPKCGYIYILKDLLEEG